MRDPIVIVITKRTRNMSRRSLPSGVKEQSLWSGAQRARPLKFKAF